MNFENKVRSLFFTECPLEVKMLEEYIRDWKRIHGGIILFPKENLHFDKLFLRSRYVFMDKIFDFSALINIIPKEKMSREYVKLHHSLAELSCELSWSGFLRRRPLFKSYALLNLLKGKIPGLKENDKLAKMLNESDPVMSLLRKTYPDDICITLSSFAQHEDSIFMHGADSLSSLVNFYNDPHEITWITSLSKLISRTLSYRRTFINIINLIDQISEVILKVTSGVKNTLGLG